MKKKFSKILGVGLTLALLTSLLMTAAPVSALSVPSVTVSPTTISAEDADYNIRFRPDKQLSGDVTSVAAAGGGGAYVLVEDGDSIVITANAANDVATLTPLKGTVTVAMSGTGTWVAGPPVAITFGAADETATVTVLTVNAAGLNDGTWVQTTGTPTAAVGVGATATDTITIVFPSGTTITDAPTVTMVAGPGWINGFWLDATTNVLSTVGTVDTRTVVITLDTGARIGESAEVRLSFTAGITNPDDAGDYNLTVETSKEDAVTSADYEITVPDIGVLPGIVQQLNAVGILMAQDTGDDAINTMVDSAGANYTLVVGPGKYEIDETIDLAKAGLTLESSGDTEDTIIKADAVTTHLILISAADVTVDGFTIEHDGLTKGIIIQADDVIVENNILTADTNAIGIELSASATGATISGNELDINSTMYLSSVSDCTLSDNTFGAGINLEAGVISKITITGNTIIGSEYEGICFDGKSGVGTFTDILIEGNTISETTEGAAVGIYVRGLKVSNLQILNNDITDNEGVGILISDEISGNVDSLTGTIKFNTITGNDADNDGYGIENTFLTTGAEVVYVDATHNWWGTSVADDIADMVNDDDPTESVTTYEPFLADTAEAVFSASDVAVGATSIAKDTADVAVSVTLGSVANDVVNVISVAKYIDNPEEAIAGAIGFYDVYVAGTFTVPDDDSVTIKFYAGDANTEVYIWSADTLTWGEVAPVSYSAYGGYVYVTIEDPAMLTGTPFALVAGAAAGLDTPPELLAPVTGDDTVSLTPIFAWGTVPDAEGYCFELADNVNFVTPIIQLDGELGRLFVTAYAYVGELEYSTPYYWRVKAVSGGFNPWIQWVQLAHFDIESAWSTGVFITMDEPEEELPPVVVEEAPPIIIEPIVEVITPAATEITPAWIYLIIGVGGVLVIALLVLIVRTRRVA